MAVLAVWVVLTAVPASGGQNDNATVLNPAYTIASGMYSASIPGRAGSVSGYGPGAPGR